MLSHTCSCDRRNQIAFAWDVYQCACGIVWRMTEGRNGIRWAKGWRLFAEEIGSNGAKVCDTAGSSSRDGLAVAGLPAPDHTPAVVRPHGMADYPFYSGGRDDAR